MSEALPSGLYDLLLTDSLEALIRERSVVTRELTESDQERMAEALAVQLS